jgi:hypothetical protein
MAHPAPAWSLLRRGRRAVLGIPLLALLAVVASLAAATPAAAVAAERSLARENPLPLLTDSDDPFALPRQNAGAAIALTTRQKLKKYSSRPPAAAPTPQQPGVAPVERRIDAEQLQQRTVFAGPGPRGCHSRAPPAAG